MSDKMSKYVSQLCHIMSDKLTNRMPDKLSDCLSKYTPDTGGDHSKKKKVCFRPHPSSLPVNFM